MRLLLLILLSPFILLSKLLCRGRQDIVNLPEDDPAMKQAVEDARAGLPEFRRLLANSEPGMADFTVKARFTAGENSEHCWVGDLEPKGEDFVGRLRNDPENLSGLKHGGMVAVAEKNISDWGYTLNGVHHGHLTTKVLLPHMSRKMRREVEAYYGWST